MTSQETTRDAAAVATRTRRPVGRPRDIDAEQRILDAAIEEYLERGAVGFSMDGVAKRAGVGKSTMYLRWPDKEALLFDSISRKSHGIEEVDTGALRSDVEQLTSNLAHYWMDPLGYATFRIAVDSVVTDVHQGTAAEVTKLHRDAARRVFTRARQRGDLRDDVIIEDVVECLYGTVVMKVIARGYRSDPVPEHEIEAIIDSTTTVMCRLLGI